MKKTLALILAIVMMAALAVPAFAETTPAQAGVLSSDTLVGEGTKGCTVTYGVSQTYTVSLPTAVNFAYGIAGQVQDQTANVSVDNFVINGSNQLVVTMDSANQGANNGWIMKDVSEGGKSTAVPYTVSAAAEDGNGANVIIPNANVANADTSKGETPTRILEVKSNVEGNGGGVDLTFETPGTQQAGDYSDQITFTVSIEAIPTPPPQE